MKPVGIRYNLDTRIATLLSTNNAPSLRSAHIAIWTGTEMIIWGGRRSGGTSLNTGGVYNPTSDTWRPMNTNNAPFVWQGYSTVWTGTELIIWGGLVLESPSSRRINTGAIYSPESNVWTPVSESNAPSARESHVGAWTGTEMIIWGGSDGSSQLKTGAIYDPISNTWKAMNSSGRHYRQDGIMAWLGDKLLLANNNSRCGALRPSN